MLRKFYPLALLAAFIFSFIHVNPVSAAPSLEVKAEAGVSNKVKYNTPIPLKVTITNNGTAFSGDLVLDAAQSYNSGSGLVYALDLAEGETKTLQLYLNGLSEQYSYDDQQKRMFYFYEGGIEEGELISHKGTKTLDPQFYDPAETFIYTLTDNSDRLSAFQKLRQTSMQNVEIFHLNQLKDFEFPNQAKGLSMANIIVVDEVSLTDYTTEQQQALHQWVKEGGTLLVGASDELQSTSGIFKKELPLILSDEKAIISQERLSELSGGGKFTDNIDVYQAQENEGSVRLLADEETILASSQLLGSGQIIQTTFSLGDEPLVSMDGYIKLISNLLDMKAPNQNQSFGMYYGGVNDYLPSEIGSVNELFPSFEVSTTLLIVIVILYILLVGPLLYWILKRMDKREHAWWIIPVFSVALSLGMFIIGAKDRLMQSQIQQSAFYQVDGDNLTGHYVESILTNRGGDFTFEMDGQTTAIASNAYSLSSPADMALHEKSYVQNKDEGSAIYFKNLNYWSVQSVIGETNVPNAGKMDIQLMLKDGKMEGTITNHFPFQLHDVAIWSGSKERVLGDLEAGETLQVSEKVKNSVLLSPAIPKYEYSQPQSKDDLQPMRLEKLKYGAVGVSKDERAPIVTAWTEEALVGIELDGNADISPLAYIAQSFQPNVEVSGDFTLDHETLQDTLRSLSTSGYMDLLDETANEWSLDKGDYEFTVWAPKELAANALWKEISIANQASGSIEMAIWNWETSSYEEIEGKSVNLTQNLKRYIAPEGQLKMRIKMMDQTGTSVKMPKVEMKGVAQS